MSIDSKESTEPVSKEVAAGASVYSNLLLSFYDVEVLMFELPLIFKRSLRNFNQFFNINISGIHRDVGVGNG